MKPARRRQLVDDLRVVWQVSIRRACDVLRVGRSMYHYRSRRPSQAVLVKRIREIAGTRVRYGYRRVHVLLRREGWQVNAKRVYRLYCEEGLQLRNKVPKRKVSAKLREDRCSATAPNEVWAMDFMSDQLFDGRRIRILTVVDSFTRLSPVVDVRRSNRGADVVDTLERVTQIYGMPKTIRVVREAGGTPQRARVHRQGSGSVGLSERRNPRLLAARQADGQRVCRII